MAQNFDATYAQKMKLEGKDQKNIEEERSGFQTGTQNAVGFIHVKGL